MNQTREPRDIQEDLAETRAGLDETIDALQQKLSPGQLFDQTLGYLRRPGGVPGGTQEFFSNLSRTIRDNPVPVALIGAGLAWLMFSGSRSRYRHPDDDYADWPEDEWSDYYGAGMATDRAETRPPYAGPSGPSVYDEDAGERTRDATDERARHSAEEARERAAALAQEAQHQTRYTSPASGVGTSPGLAGSPTPSRPVDPGTAGTPVAGSAAKPGETEGKNERGGHPGQAASASSLDPKKP